MHKMPYSAHITHIFVSCVGFKLAANKVQYAITVTMSSVGNTLRTVSQGWMKREEGNVRSV